MRLNKKWDFKKINQLINFYKVEKEKSKNNSDFILILKNQFYYNVELAFYSEIELI